ncbi:TPA: helix-turn-helix transcriptional regulator [Streptococcus suis]|nr:helix-turn-helix transcriptional regulator [Streptococcus suis]
MNDNWTNKVKALRKVAKKTMKEVSEETGIGLSSISNYENGYSNPKRENAEKLADYFGVSVPYLLGIDDNSNPSLPTSPKSYLSKQEELSQLIDTIVKTKALDSYLQFLCHKEYSSESINTLTQLIYDYLDIERKAIHEND